MAVLTRGAPGGRATLADQRITTSDAAVGLPERDARGPFAAFLQASSFTSILAFGGAVMALGTWLLFILIGFGIRDAEQRVAQLRS